MAQAKEVRDKIVRLAGEDKKRLAALEGHAQKFTVDGAYQARYYGFYAIACGLYLTLETFRANLGDGEPLPNEYEEYLLEQAANKVGRQFPDVKAQLQNAFPWVLTGFNPTTTWERVCQFAERTEDGERSLAIAKRAFGIIRFVRYRMKSIKGESGEKVFTSAAVGRANKWLREQIDAAVVKDEDISFADFRDLMYELDTNGEIFEISRSDNGDIRVKTHAPKSEMYDFDAPAGVERVARQASGIDVVLRKANETKTE